MGFCPISTHTHRSDVRKNHRAQRLVFGSVVLIFPLVVTTTTSGENHPLKRAKNRVSIHSSQLFLLTGGDLFVVQWGEPMHWGESVYWSRYRWKKDKSIGLIRRMAVLESTGKTRHHWGFLPGTKRTRIPYQWDCLIETSTGRFNESAEILPKVIGTC